VVVAAGEDRDRPEPAERVRDEGDGHERLFDTTLDGHAQIISAAAETAMKGK
jgi:hypothetical protein